MSLLIYTCINGPKCKTHTMAVFAISLLIYTCTNLKKCKNVKLFSGKIEKLTFFKIGQNRLAGLKSSCWTGFWIQNDLRGPKSLWEVEKTIWEIQKSVWEAKKWQKWQSFGHCLYPSFSYFWKNGKNSQKTQQVYIRIALRDFLNQLIYCVYTCKTKFLVFKGHPPIGGLK